MLKIAGWQAPLYAELNLGFYDISKAGRSASGLMLKQDIAEKMRVDVVFDKMADSDFKQLLDVVRINKPFFTIEFPHPGGQKTITAYVGDITTSLWHTVNGVRYWDSVSVSFIEQ